MKPSKLTLNITSLILALAGAVLSVGDKITAIPSLPGWLVNAWPVILVLATVVHRCGSIMNDLGKPKP